MRDNPTRKSHYLEDADKEERPHTIDVIGSGPKTTICGHIDLLCLLPLHNNMHKKLLDTFRNKPGSYEGKYNSGSENKASVINYGNGYLALHISHDLTRPEMSDFLLAHDWRMLNAHCTVKEGKDVIFEKWTNVIASKPASGRRRVRAQSVPRRYY